jgi:hypothetical protein
MDQLKGTCGYYQLINQIGAGAWARRLARPGTFRLSSEGFFFGSVWDNLQKHFKLTPLLLLVVSQLLPVKVL